MATILGKIFRGAAQAILPKPLGEIAVKGMDGVNSAYVNATKKTTGSAVAAAALPFAPASKSGTSSTTSAFPMWGWFVGGGVLLFGILFLLFKRKR